MRRFTSYRAKIKQPTSSPTAKGGASASATTATGQAPTGREETVARDKARELGGPDGLEPTRYGDWERKGICYDF
ncbi:DUF1674 domain-containing protein [Fodinicurvata halophila]|uniref:DUF1674 domain-containing protein n=1 Tax=Fodinicurvata halophila TaxID=1419723 RepID=A0ABV8UM61_9PROT